jgi:hypothetical protein
MCSNRIPSSNGGVLTRYHDYYQHRTEREYLVHEDEDLDFPSQEGMDLRSIISILEQTNVGLTRVCSQYDSVSPIPSGLFETSPFATSYNFLFFICRERECRDTHTGTRRESSLVKRQRSRESGMSIERFRRRSRNWRRLRKCVGWTHRSD